MDQETQNRAGEYVFQSNGYSAFIPNPLPPAPPIKVDDAMLNLLSSADRAIGRLDAATELLPNPDLFVAMYVRKEAVYSSQIEGTQASLSDLLEFEARNIRNRDTIDVQETFNYVLAMNYGLDRLKTLPLSLRLIKEIHLKLLDGVRGKDRDPGEFRKAQNWIGSYTGCPVSEASFVPPPPHEVLPALGELEKFIHDDLQIPPLIKCGLIHAQFETIHPFLDGNGRIGRLLITFMLCWRNILKRPLLYLSHYFKQHRDEYYKRLQAIRDHGDWESWMKFFLTGVRDVSLQAIETARSIQSLREQHRQLVSENRCGLGGIILLDNLFELPYTKTKDVAKLINKSYPMANQLVATFESLGILTETTGQQRNREYAYKPYLDIFKA